MNCFRTLFVVGTLLLAGGACAHRAVGPQHVLSGGETVEERVLRFRSVVQDLRKSPFADEVSTQLNQAEAWLERVATKASAQNGSAEEVTLLLDSTEAQLIYVRAMFGRREAEEALATSRTRFEGHTRRARELGVANRTTARSIQEGGL